MSASLWNRTCSKPDFSKHVKYRKSEQSLSSVTCSVTQDLYSHNYAYLSTTTC